MKKLSKHHSLSLVVSAVTAILSSGVQADYALEEIVVTAQKRAESMQDVPTAVSAIGSNDIEALGWDNAQDIAAQVPNMQVSSPYGEVQPLFSIRGISMVDYNPGQSSPIGVYTDEAYLGSPYLHGLSMFDLERIEVLRGPQGTLYGKNTTGGAINLNSRTPQIGTEVNGYVSGGMGNYDMYTSNGAVEGTLVEDVLAARLAFTYKKDEGTWDNAAGPDMSQTDYRGARLTLNYEPSDKLSAVLKIASAKSSPRASALRADAGVGPGGVNYAGNTETVDSNYHEGAIDNDGKSETEMTSVNLKLSYELGDYDLVSVSSFYDGDYFQRTDSDGTSDPLVAHDWASNTESVSQDLRLVSNFDGPFNFIAGLYYGHEDVNSDTTFTEFLGGALPLHPDLAVSGIDEGVLGEIQRRQDLLKETKAVYTHFTYDLNEKVGLTLGVRYTEDETSMNHYNISRQNGSSLSGPLTAAPFFGVSDSRTSGTWVGGSGNQVGFDGPIAPAGGVASGHAIFPDGTPLDLAFTHGAYSTASAPERSNRESEFTGTFIVDYQLTDDAMTYVSLSRGFRAGAYNSGLTYIDLDADQDPNTSTYVSPEYIDAYEIGFKGEFFDNRLRLNGAVFLYDYTDQQFINNVGLSEQLVNAGASKIKGLELEILAMPLEGLTLQAGLGLIDAEYEVLSLPIIGDSEGATIDLSGNEPVATPEMNFNLAVDYEMEVGSDYVARLHLDGNFVSEQFFSAYNELVGHEDIKQGDYWLWNARTTFSDASERYAVSIWAANLLDKEYDVFALNIQNVVGHSLFTEGTPRSYGVDFTVRF